MRSSLLVVAGVGLSALIVGGCATKSYVQAQVDQSTKSADAKIGEVQKQVEESQMDVAALKKSSTDQGAQLAQLSDTARDALTRAEAAGKLAQGKFLYEVVLNDDSAHFAFNRADLSEQTKKALDQVAGKLKQDNKSVYIEIQGFTDATGPTSYNLKLGEDRAESVMRYLNMNDGVPLHRMNAISYGAEKPAADNKTREGRAKNRRVVLVVLS
ncbi:MAG: OmpA family protein [Thermoanaerobaculales bacterium]